MEMVIMTEPACCELDQPTGLSDKKENKGVHFFSDAENGSDEKKIAKHPGTVPQIRINDSDLLNSSRKRPLPRAKIYDSTLTLDMKNEMKRERKKSSSSQFSKTNAHYHKLFKEVPKEELLIESFTCALQKEILYQGKLYISANWICFHSKVFGKDTKIAIPVITITLIKKTKTALLVPNALVISTVSDRFIFVSLLSRDSTYKLIKSLCGHLENTSTGNSPNPSPAEHNFRADRPASFPLDFSVDFSELDGLVRPRRKEIEECSSTGSQTAESENSQEFQGHAQNILTKSQQFPVRADITIKQTQERHHTSEHKNGRLRFFQWVDIWEMVPLNGLLFCYSIIVCLLIFSTFYMQSRLGYLEKKLTLLGSSKDSPLNVWTAEQGLGSWHINANTICDELTDNLAKLDKIQRNLQRLLEESN